MAWVGRNEGGGGRWGRAWNEGGSEQGRDDREGEIKEGRQVGESME